MILVRGPFLQDDPSPHEVCPRCEEGFLEGEGVTSLESERVFLCLACSEAEERDARMVGRGEEACAS